MSETMWHGGAPSPRQAISRSAANTLAQHATDSGQTVIALDLARCADKSDLLAATAGAFRFPDWFGHNWDALSDSLADLSWLPAPGYLLLIERYASLAGSAPEAWQTFLDILDETQARLQDDGTPWHWHLVDTKVP